MPCHGIIGLFEVLDTFEIIEVGQVKSLLVEHDFTNKIIAYIKDERKTLNIFTSSVTSVVSCASLEKNSPFSDTCFRHVIFKACKYAISDTRIKYMMKKVSDQISKCFAKNNNLDKEIKEGEARMGTLHVRRLT